jgi:hypothetical protein
MLMKFPFEVTPAEIETKVDEFIDAVFSCLTSEFLIMPRGEGFVIFPDFESGYEALKQGTNGFSAMNDQDVFGVIMKCPIAFVVLRAILGFTFGLPLKARTEFANWLLRPAVSSRMGRPSFFPTAFIGWTRPIRKQASPIFVLWRRWAFHTRWCYTNVSWVDPLPGTGTP